MSVAAHEDARALLGGARRVRTRVRGFALWAPRGTTLELLEQVRGVLDEYEETPAQITQYGLEAAPPKATDKRAFRGRTCQAEALAPDVLARPFEPFGREAKAAIWRFRHEVHRHGRRLRERASACHAARR